MIKTEQLRYLIELEKTKSFHKCAENLYLSQPAISLSIRNLEKELGVKLFERTSTGVIPTEIGLEVIQQAHKALFNINELYLLCDKYQYQEKNITLDYLKIYSTNSFSSVILPFIVPTLQKEFPDANFSFYEYAYEELFPQIAENKYSIGFHYGWSDDIFTSSESFPEVKMQSLYDISFYLASAKSAAFRPKEPIFLAGATKVPSVPIPLISYNNHAELTLQILEQLVKRKIVQVTMHVPTTSLYYSYIQQGLASGVVLKLGEHKFISSIDLSSVSFTPIETEKKAKLFMFYHKDLPVPIYQLLLRYLDTYFELA